jgi:hippurate hydrolase
MLRSRWQTKAGYRLVVLGCFILLRATCAEGQVASAGVTPAGSAVSDWVAANLDRFIAFYRELHAHPEVSFQEKWTSQQLSSAWEKIGAKTTTHVGGYGVVAVLANGAGPTLMLRCDMDALPIEENTGLAFSSQMTATLKDGTQSKVMHACGHDVHMTNVVAAAEYLAAHLADWSGTLVLIGQPAEERGAGAKAMLEDGLWERFPKPDFAIALHVSSDVPAGEIGYRGGYSLANVDSVDVVLKGRGGHGALPHTTIDPIVQAAHLVMDLQTIVSREISALEPAVVTVGSIHGGSKHNIIPNECKLQLTVRSYSDEVRKKLIGAIRRKAKAVADSAGADTPDVHVSEGTPSLWNDEPLTERLIPVFRSVVGADRAVAVEPAMVGEDFSRFGRAGVPIHMFRLGTIEARRLDRYRQLDIPPPSLHSAEYYPDIEPTLKTSIPVTVAVALELLKKS